MAKLEEKLNKSRSNRQDILDKQNKPAAAKSKHIRVYFDKSQRKTLNEWFGVRRYIYNKCLDYINKHQEYTVGDIRTHIINNENYTNENTWMLKYNWDLRDEA
ncbi:hypothetical protein CCP3SC1AL1_1100007 [Gammaproteobacteria bacterium]